MKKGVIALCCYIFGEAGVDIARAIWNGAASRPTEERTPVIVEEAIPPGEIDVEAVEIHNKVPDDEAEDESDQSHAEYM